MVEAQNARQEQAEQHHETTRSGGQSVAGTVIDSMTLINRYYVYEFASEAYCRDHGRSRTDVVGQPVAAIWGEANFNKVMKKHLDQCFAGNVVRYEKWLGLPGEDTRCYRVSYSPYFNANGLVTHAVVASQDITDLKKEEESIEKSQTAFKSILKNMHYGVFTFDTDGRFVFVNDVVVQRSGYPREWYVDKRLFDVVRPDEREKVREHFNATLRGEHVPPYEFAYQKAADKIAWVQISTTAIREEGRIIGVLGVILDITKRVKSEQALRESEKKYRTLFEDSRDAIFITDRKGSLTDVNRSFLKLFGYTKEELKGMRAIDTYVDREECKRLVRIIDEQGFVEGFEAKLRKKDGTVMDCVLNGTPVLGGEGNVQSYQGIARIREK